MKTQNKNRTINIEQLSQTAFEQIYELDTKFVGTSDYMGLAYFWNYEYRHFLRDASQDQRKRVHKAFIKSKLSLEGESDAHQNIILTIIK